MLFSFLLSANIFCSKRKWHDESDLKTQVFKKKNEKADENTYNAYAKDIAVANFYFESTTCLEFTRDAMTTPTDFFSNIGGILGLCMGISCISIIELMYWLIIKMFGSLCYL